MARDFSVRQCDRSLTAVKTYSITRRRFALTDAGRRLGKETTRRCSGDRSHGKVCHRLLSCVEHDHLWDVMRIVIMIQSEVIVMPDKFSVVFADNLGITVMLILVMLRTMREKTYECNGA